MTLAVPPSIDEPLVLHGDCLELMRRLPDGCVHLIATDPPYYRVKGDAWDRQWSSASAFIAWIGELADEWRRILAPNGSLYVFASPQMAARVEVTIAERLAVLNSIVWAKPAFSTKAEMFDKSTCRTYFPATERIIFAEQPGAGGAYVSQCESLRIRVMDPIRSYVVGEIERAGLTRKDINMAVGSSSSGGGMASHYVGDTHQWELPTARNYAAIRRAANRDGGDYLRREYDDLRREYDDLRREYDDLRREYDRLRRPFTVSADVPYTDVWTFPTVLNYPGKHPCEKPRAMMDHIIRASSRPGDVVLDCFLGSGVTGEAAVANGRRFIGMEMGDYIHGARRRIAQAIGTPEAAARVNAVSPEGSQLALL